MPKTRSGLGAARHLDGLGGARPTVPTDRTRPTEPAGRNAYRQFSDEASGTHEYWGDGREAVEFVRSHTNFEDLVKKMSYSERDAFENFWAPGRFMHGQQYRGFDNMTSREQEVTRIMDKYLDQSRLDEGITVARLGSGRLLGIGSKARSLAELKALEGQIIYSAGAQSAGMAKHGLSIGQDKNIEYRIRIPPSTGAGMWLGDKRVNFWGARQREYIINRDSEFRVGKTTYDADRDVYVVDMKWLGRRKHDYGRSGR